MAENQGRPPSPDINEEDRVYLHARQNPNQIANRITRGTQRLGYYTVVCFLLNRIIGTGIFISPGTVYQDTQNVGFSLLFWVFGAINAFAVSYLYIEFGLNIPRYDRIGPVPRNGGELNYLNYLIQRPAFLATCIFGITFILLGSTAGNAISFADNLWPQQSPAVTRIVAISVVTFSCLIHGTWRRGGIWLNNIIALVKVLIVFIFPVLAICALAGVNTQNATCTNTDHSKAITDGFRDNETDQHLYSWSNAFLSVIFAYDGFNQANYVLGEIDRPREVFPKAVMTAVALVASLYIISNISLMIIIHKSQLVGLTGTDPQNLVRMAFANFIGCDEASRLFAAFTAISSLGNVIVMTFTAARVKQEIAKEGILPFAKFFGESLGDSDEPNFRSEPIPVGALLLHWFVAVLLILVTWPAGSSSYTILIDVYSYTIDAFFSTAIGIGMLYLRFTRTSSGGRWRDKSSSNHIISIISAVVTVVANAFPIISSWFPLSGSQQPISSAVSMVANTFKFPPGWQTQISYPWYVTATVAWSALACSVVYWLVFRFVPPRFGRRRGMAFVVEREPFMHTEHGYHVQYHEIVTFSWVTEQRRAVDFQLMDRALPD